MGKVKLEEVVKELQRMSKRMAKVSRLLTDLSQADDEFNKKAEELMGASLICDSWADSIFNKHLKESLNEERFKEAIKNTKG
jgi:hypothetical protein